MCCASAQGHRARLLFVGHILKPRRVDLGMTTDRPDVGLAAVPQPVAPPCRNPVNVRFFGKLANSLMRRWI
jgi:hypothetical protein